jgi:hypothetical protein
MRKVLIMMLLIFAATMAGCREDAEAGEQGQVVRGSEQEFVPSCPRGLIDDQYPGSCGIYADSDSNHICDLSEP